MQVVGSLVLVALAAGVETPAPHLPPGGKLMGFYTALRVGSTSSPSTRARVARHLAETRRTYQAWLDRATHKRPRRAGVAVTGGRKRRRMR